MGNILVVDDIALQVKVAKDMLSKEGYPVLTARNYREAESLLEKEDIDLVFLDLNMPEVDGLKALKFIKAKYQGIPVVMLTAENDAAKAVEAIKLGAEDYITKDAMKEKLVLCAKNILKSAGLSREVKQLKDYLNAKAAPEKIVFKSKAMEDMLKLAEKAANTDITVLILGDSGTGKELISKYIHFKSKRSAKQLIAIDCAMLPENLVESELFGYEKGAFTGATERKPGRIELADEGTLFLDEIGNLPPDVQRKLLRFLEEKTIEHIGGKTSIKINARLITASNVDLLEEVKQKRFREDLYYRLNVLTVVIPPLKERGEDIILLAKHFLERFAKVSGKKTPVLSAAAEKSLLSYDWPGNVRELRNVIERASLLAEKEILPEHLPVAAAEAISSDAGLLEVGKEAAKEAEKKYLLRVLDESKGNKSKAAKKLKIDYKTLYNKMKEYGLCLLLAFSLFVPSVFSQDKAIFSLEENFPVEIDGQFVYSSPVFADINNDGIDEIIAESSGKIYILDKKGVSLAGFPAVFPMNERCENNPAVGDVDGDGSLEIVTALKSGPDQISIRIYDKEGKLKFNTPWIFKGTMDYGTSPVLFDIDGDGSLEIFFTASMLSSNGANVAVVYIIKKNGTIMPGWPAVVLPEGNGSQWLSTPVIADMNKDGTNEIICATVSGKIFFWEPTGFLFNEKPYFAGEGEAFYVKPAIADIDKDGWPEVVIGSCNNAQSGNLYAIKFIANPEKKDNRTGEWENVMGFPVNLKSNIQSIPAIGDLNGDGSQEIVVGTNVGNKVYVINNTGETLANWPAECKGWMCNNPLLVDLDNDKSPEILIGCREPLVYGYRLSGALLTGFPLELTKEPYIIYRTPAVTIEKDGTPYICYSADKKLFLWKGTRL